MIRLHQTGEDPDGGLRSNSRRFVSGVCLRSGSRGNRDEASEQGRAQAIPEGDRGPSGEWRLEPAGRLLRLSGGSIATIGTGQRGGRSIRTTSEFSR